MEVMRTEVDARYSGEIVLVGETKKTSRFMVLDTRNKILRGVGGEGVICCSGKL